MTLTLTFFSLSVTGGLICLDRIYAQTLVSRPIVVGSLTGLLLGDLGTGVMIGALLELLWIDRAPIGTMVPPNDTVSTLLIVSCCILGGQNLVVAPLDHRLVAVATLLLLPTAILGQALDWFLCRRNEDLVVRALSCAEQGDIAGVERQHLLALIRTFLVTTCLILVLLCVGYHVLIRVYPLIPARMLTALGYVYYLIPLTGIAAALVTIRLKRMLPVFLGIYILLITVLERMTK